MDTNSTSRTVYLNPNFRSTHINPNFLISKLPSSIHVNPAFLENLPKPQDNTGSYTTSAISSNSVPAKIISKSRTKIIREPMKNCRTNEFSRSPLIKIGLRKLVRASIASKTAPPLSVNVKKSVLTPKKKYKIDRRIVKKRVLFLRTSKKSFVSQYALKRTNVDETLVPKKVVITQRKLMRIGFSDQLHKKREVLVSNKKLELLNINGVLYKSTKNKLQRAINSENVNKEVKKIAQISTGRIVVVRGEKFVLDKTGKSLVRANIPSKDNIKLKRIDIGGLTYIAKSASVFVRTETHKTRNHLNTARQKSIQTLSKKLVKSNVPCPIFRKVGKCAAFERGKCPKVHDKIHISICQKFLRGECSNDKCLLSHDVSLSKMPTCKFFLQGCCIREDCPYLHKKLSGNAEICLDFLKGFCHLAEKCDKRHEYLCADFEKTGKCEKVKCPYCRKKDKTQKQNNLGENLKAETKRSSKQLKSENKIQEETKEKVVSSRYFIDESEISDSENINTEFKENEVGSSIDNILSDSNVENISQFNRRPKLGELPAFIPL